MKKALAVFVVMVSVCSSLADGMVFVREEVPPNIPYQRALILYQDGKETLILQSKFEMPGSVSTNTVLGWVVPVPSVPQLSSMKSNEGFVLFRTLGWRSSPDVTEISMIIMGIVFCLSLLLIFVLLVLLIISAFLPRWHLDRSRLVRIMFYAFIVCYFLMLSGLFAMSGGSGGVEVVESSQVGIYDAKVIKATGSADLIAWLSENGFAFPPEVKPVLDDYIKSGWCFVVAKVRPEERIELSNTFEGLIDPLILRFETSKPVYPLALTSTIGVDTEVLIYFLSDRKMQCDDRMKLQFAQRCMEKDWQYLGPDDEDKLLDWETSLVYLCKFKGKLTPEQMKQDLYFTPAADSAAYRKHVFRW